jgi:tetratricopeptide (TPR) repeat protein
MSFLPDDEETLDEPYSEIWRHLDLSPERIVERERRREAAGKLFAELAGAPLDAQAALLRQERFQNLDLLDLLLEESQDSQPADPPRAEDMAHLAARLASTLADEEPEAVAALPRAFCLGANARRLGGEVEGADAMLAKAAPFVEFSGERAVYCRVAALVRWEQGRIDEAEALLRHAARLFAAEGLGGDEASCRGLLGLLQMEEPGLDDPLPALLEGWSETGRGLRPGVALRVGLSAALCQAERGRPEQARSTLRESWRLLAEISDPRETTRAFWLEARVLGRLGESLEALQILESVRQKLFTEPSPAEAALASIDLGLLLAESGRAGEIEILAEALRTSFPGEAMLIVSAGGLLRFAELALAGEPDPRLMARHAAATMRRTFRVARLSLQPMPFA